MVERSQKVAPEWLHRGSQGSPNRVHNCNYVDDVPMHYTRHNHPTRHVWSTPNPHRSTMSTVVPPSTTVVPTSTTLAYPHPFPHFPKIAITTKPQHARSTPEPPGNLHATERNFTPAWYDRRYQHHAPLHSGLCNTRSSGRGSTHCDAAPTTTTHYPPPPLSPSAPTATAHPPGPIDLG